MIEAVELSQAVDLFGRHVECCVLHAEGIGEDELREGKTGEMHSVLFWVNLARKDVVRLIPRGNVKVRMRFRDWLGRYPMHCHNVIHEDHAMMLRFDVATTGDTNSNP